MVFLDDPSTITNKNLQTVHHRLRQPLCQSTLIKDDAYIFLREHINSDTYVNLRLVSFDLRKTLFLAFHSNPLGGHYPVYYTFHRIRLWYFWPEMYSFIKRMCKLCAACGLANSSSNPSKELVYQFSIDVPFKLICGDIYKAGDMSFTI